MTRKIERLVKIGAFLLFCALLMIVIPKLVPNLYFQTVTNTAIIYSIAILGLTVILGMGGQVTFSIAGTLGIGAYVTGLFTVRHPTHPLLAVVLAILITAVFSLIIGLALFRLKGTYFAFASIALVEIIFSILLNWRFLGGADGISRIPPLDLGFMVCESRLHYFYVFFVLAVICGLVVEQIRRSSLGRALASIRDNEIAARCLGVNVYRTRVISFVLAGVFSGLAGSMLAFQSTNITADLFTFRQSQIFLIMGMLGGIASTWGAYIGATLLTLLPEMMRALANYYKFIYGIGVILLMIFMPMGIAGLIRQIRKHTARRLNRKKKVVSHDEPNS